jgi:hypothetical protein
LFCVFGLPDFNRSFSIRELYAASYAQTKVYRFSVGIKLLGKASGILCVLIHNSVFKAIPFRFVEGDGNHPDSFFNEDCFRKGIKVYADTSIHCRHDNRAWGIYGVDFK